MCLGLVHLSRLCCTVPVKHVLVPPAVQDHSASTQRWYHIHVNWCNSVRTTYNNFSLPKRTYWLFDVNNHYGKCVFLLCFKITLCLLLCYFNKPMFLWKRKQPCSGMLRCECCSLLRNDVPSVGKQVLAGNRGYIIAIIMGWAPVAIIHVLFLWLLCFDITNIPMVQLPSTLLKQILWIHLRHLTLMHSVLSRTP